jgi:SAM-dependent methyltransferase
VKVDASGILFRYRVWLPRLFEPPCELCGAREAYLVGRESTERCRTVVCVNCGLTYARPQPSPSEVDVLNLHNLGDAGSLASAPCGILDAKDLRVEERVASWAVNVIARFTPIAGTRILSLRCLSGALAATFRQQGAEVYGVDPFDTNIRHARRERGLSDTLTIPMSRFHELRLPWDSPFDIIEGLSVHVLAHVMSPRQFLSRILDLLKPGGYLFLDEKDVLLPAPGFADFVLDTGPAHQHHLTCETTARYVRSLGFELLDCQIDQERVSSFHHIRVVARKPAIARAVTPLVESTGDAGKGVVRQLQRLAWAAWVNRQRKTMSARSHHVLRQILGRRQMRRSVRH